MKILFTMALVFTTILLGGVSCNMDMEGQDNKYASYVKHVISVADLQASSDDGRALIDLWTPEYGYSVADGMDYGAIDVFCPSGRFMTLEQLVNEVGGPLDEEAFLFSSGAAALQVKTSPCDEKNSGCFWHKEPGDYTWVCICY